MKNKIIRAKSTESIYDEFDGKVGINTMYLIINMKNISIEILKESLRYTVRDVPVMSCRLVKAFWKDKWMPIDGYDVDQVIKTIEVSKDSFYDKAYEQFLQLSDKRIDIEKEPPFKVKVFYNEEISNKVIVFCIHHALVDGRGCFRLLKLIASHYNAILQNKPLTQQKNYRNVSKLIFSLKLKNFVDMFATSIKSMSQKSKMNTAMKPLLEETDIVVSGNGCETIERMMLNEDTIHKLKAYFKDYDLTVNNILMLLTLKLMVKYNMAIKEPSTYTCVAYGIDLRRYFKKDVLSVANYSVMDSFTVKTEDVDNLSNMAKEFKALKKKSIGLGVIVEPLMTSVFPIAIQRDMLNKWAKKFIIAGSVRAIQTTNIGRTDEYVAPFGDIVDNVSFVGCSPVCGFPQVSIARHRDTLTLYFLKYNDVNGLCRKVKDDYNELINEVIA